MKTIFVLFTEDSEGPSIDGFYSNVELAKEAFDKEVEQHSSWTDCVVTEVELDKASDLYDGTVRFTSAGCRYPQPRGMTLAEMLDKERETAVVEEVEEDV